MQILSKVQTEKGAILSIQKKHDLAIAEFDRALAISPFHWAYERKGGALYSLHKYAEAITVLNDAEKTNNSCSETYALRGACLLKLGQIQDSLTDLNKSLEINPEHYWAMLRRGELYLETKEFELAFADFESVMQVSEGFRHESLKNIGLVYAAQEKYKDAADKFLLSLDTTPDCSHCWTALIETYEKLYDRNIVADLMAVANFPNIDFSVSVRLCRVAAYSKCGYKEAIEELNIAIEMNPNLKTSIPNWVDINSLGLKLGMSDQYEDAIKCFEFEAYSDSYVYRYNKAVAMALWKGIEFSEKEIKTAEESLKSITRAGGYELGLGMYGLAGLEAMKNNKHSSLLLLKQAISVAPGVIVFAKNTDPAWKAFRSDPEFQEIISKS